MQLLEIRKKLKKELDKDRYEHTIGVMFTAAGLAMANEAPVDQAMLAGLLHDCAKNIPSSEKIALCKKKHYPISNAERENPSLLHAKAGAVLARSKYHVTDREILHAIEVHTTGAPDMNLLDKIIYVADYIEPNRNKAPRLAEIRRIAFADIDRCVAEILYDTLFYLHKGKKLIDPVTEETFLFYRDYLPDERRNMRFEEM